MALFHSHDKMYNTYDALLILFLLQARLINSINKEHEWYNYFIYHQGYSTQGLSVKNSEYDQEIPRSHTADQPTALRGRATTFIVTIYL